MQFPFIGLPLITRRAPYMVRRSPDDDIALVKGYHHLFHQPAVDYHDPSDPYMYAVYNHGQSVMHNILDARTFLTGLGRINITRHTHVLPETRRESLQVIYFPTLCVFEFARHRPR